MTNATPAMVPDGVNSLYRRFRPGRFSEIRGQEHVVRALQGAVANDRVVHAYLFSGPRGTGKTSTARILAKALNCENLTEGDPCNACASCVSITQGSSLDVVELDAASNNGVEYVRELAASAWIGTAGRHRVYIIDEVHMLTKASSNALLKTLEEPPHGVVFVLATTDPHKVLDTIKSRTQHLEFRLIAPTVLHDLLADVVAKAKLTVEAESLDIAIQRAKGSARDALSALDQIVASGLRPDLRANFDGLFDSLARTDVVAALSAIALLTSEGWDPEQLAENFIGELRQTFLLLTAPDLSLTYGGDRERLAAWGQQIGLPTIVRAIESLGRAVREMHSAPDATVVLEVTLARLTHPELDANVAALMERVSKLEKQLAQGVTATAPPKSAAPSSPIAGLQRVEKAAPPSPSKPAVTVPESTVGPEVAAAPEAIDATVEAPVSTAPLEISEDDLLNRFAAKVIPSLLPTAQALLRTSEVRSFRGNTLTIALEGPNHRPAAERIQDGLMAALSREFGTRISVEWAYDAAPRSNKPETPRYAAAEEDEVTDDDLDRGTVVNGDFQADIIRQAFPNAEEVQ